MESLWVWLAVYLAASVAAGLLFSWVATRRARMQMRALQTRVEGFQKDLGDLEESVGGLTDMTNRHTQALNDITLASLSDVIRKATGGKVSVEERNLNDCPHRDSKDPNETSIHFHGPLPPNGAKLTLTMEREQEGVEERHIWQKLEITNEGVKDVTPQVRPSQMDPTLN